VPWNMSGDERRASDRMSAGRCVYVRDAFYGGETAAKANKNAPQIVVEGRKARKRESGVERMGHSCPRKHGNEKDGGKWAAVA